MTFHGNRLIHNPRKRSTLHTDTINTIDTMGNTHTLTLSTAPIAIHTASNHTAYRSSSCPIKSSLDPMASHVFKDNPTSSSINFKPVNITFSKHRKEAQKYDVIDIANLKPTVVNTTDDACAHTTAATFTHHRHHRHYRHSPTHNYKSELFGACKWCIFCLAALGSCIIFVSHLLQITGSTISHFDAPIHPYSSGKYSLPHHATDRRHYGYHQIERGSIANAYVNRNRIKSSSASNLHRIPIEMHANHPYKGIDDLNIMSMEQELTLQNQNRHTQRDIHVMDHIKHEIKRNQHDADKQYHLVRNDKYSILHDILFLVFKSNLNGEDGRQAIKHTWATKYKGLYDINIKFVNTGSQKFATDADGNLFEDVMEAPFVGDSAMCLLWAMHEYSDGYEWIFKVEDLTFVMIENVVDYLNEIELESAVAQKNNEPRYYWWLGHRVQQKPKDENSIFTYGGAGYILNRAIIDVIVSDIHRYEDEDRHPMEGEQEDGTRYNKYMMCKQQGITWEDLCIAYLLNVKHNIHSISSLDMDHNEKFNVWDPIILFGYNGMHKLPVDWYTKYKQNIGELPQKEGIDYISKTPITFHFVKPEWMRAYYDLFYSHKNAKDIEIISRHIAKNKKAKIREEQFKNLNDYAQIVTQYSLTNHIKNIDNEMQHIATDINYNVVP